MAALLDQGFADVGVGATLVARHEAPPSPPEQQVVAEAEPSAAAPSRPREKLGQLTKAARSLASHLSPVAKAEAAPAPHQLQETDRWSIQLGAFAAEAEAEQAARSVASLPVAKGKPFHIVRPSKSGKDHLYRARLLNFTPQEAQGACAALHKKRIECSVLPPTPVKVAAR